MNKSILLVFLLTLSGCKMNNPFDPNFSGEDVKEVCAHAGGTLDQQAIHIGVNKGLFTSSMTITWKCKLS